MERTTYTIEEIRKFIADRIGCDEEEIFPESDIVYDLGCTGDDFDELIHAYAQKYSVQMDGYLWYFHSEDEGYSNNIGGLFFKAPYERVAHIPVSLSLLLRCANEGKWLLIYPEHSLPKRRYDMIINLILILLFIAFIIYRCAK